MGFVGCHQISFAATELVSSIDPDIYCLPRNTNSLLQFDNALIGRWTTGGDRLTFSLCSDIVSYVRCAVQFWVPGRTSVIFSTAPILVQTPVTPTADTPAASISYQQSLGSMAPAIFGETGTSCSDFFGGCTYWTVPPISDPLIFWPPPAQLPKFDMLGTNVYHNYFEATNAQPLQRTYIGVIALTAGTTEVFSRSRLNEMSVALISLTNELGEAPVLPDDAFDLNEKTQTSPSFYLPTISLSSFPVVDLAELCDETSYQTLQSVVNDELTTILETDSLELIEFHKVCFNSNLRRKEKGGRQRRERKREEVCMCIHGSSFKFKLRISYLFSSQYVLDILNAGIAGTSCRQAAIEAMDTSIENITLVEQSFCRYGPDTTEWNDDPCCNFDLRVCEILFYFYFLHSIPLTFHFRL